jgi:1-aminocyclopropane-1-carboxylate deaminase
MKAEIINIHTLENYKLAIKREDLLFPDISGNKFRKLKYQIEKILMSDTRTLLTFGGAYSNHIAAVAAAGKKYQFKTIGIIRGEELGGGVSENATLSFAREQGMQLEFISREAYRMKESQTTIDDLKERYGDFYLIPEGGTNALAVKGCEEILTSDDASYDYICISVGTGGTLAGIVSSALPHQQVLGFSALKGTFQKEVVSTYTSNSNYKIVDDYNFGGYAKIDTLLVRFINEFKIAHKIQLDPVYTGKMMYGIYDLMEKQYFKENSRILAIHTGGLQGIAGMNETLKRKKLPRII